MKNLIKKKKEINLRYGKERETGLGNECAELVVWQSHFAFFFLHIYEKQLGT